MSKATIIPDTIASSIEIDINSLEFELPTELDNLHSLEVFEGQVVIAFSDLEEAYGEVNDAYTRAAYHIHMLLEHQLWRHRLTPDRPDPITGKMMYKPLYNIQEDFLEDLASRTVRGFGVSTVKGFHTALRRARQLGFTRQQIEASGVHVFNQIAKKLEPGESLKLKDGPPPGGKGTLEYLREVVETVTANPERPDIVLKPHDFKIQLEKMLSPRKARIEFNRMPGQPMTTFQWFYDRASDDGMPDIKVGNIHVQFADSPPNAVIEEFFRLLKVSLD